MNGVCLDSDDVMVSYDVSSLFTNVPIQEAIDAIRDMLQKDETLDERTVLSPDRIVELLETYLRSTYTSATMGTSMSRWRVLPWALQCPLLWPTCIWSSLKKWH